MINIGFINYKSSFPPKEGGSVYTHYTLEYLTKLGHKIHVFDCEKNPKFKKYPFNRRGLIKMALAVDVFAVNMEGDSAEDDFTLKFITRISRKPIFWHIQAPLEEQFVILKTDLADMPRLIKIRKQAAKLVSAASCVSQEMARYAKEELGIQNSHYVPNGSDPELFSPDKRDESLYRIFKDKIKILWIGSPQYPWQGLPLVYKTAKILLNDERFLFIVIGERKFIRVPMLKNMVAIDSVDHQDMPAYIASADICLCVYQKCEWAPWGFHFSPVKLFDYMASGKPVIASNMGELGRVIKRGKNGFLVSHKSKKAIGEIAKYVKLFAADESLRLRIGEEARKDVVRFYNWERAAKQTSDILQNIV